MKRQFFEIAKSLPTSLHNFAQDVFKGYEPLVIINSPLVGLKWHNPATHVSIFSNTQFIQIPRIAP